MNSMVDITAFWDDDDDETWQDFNKPNGRINKPAPIETQTNTYSYLLLPTRLDYNHYRNQRLLG